MSRELDEREPPLLRDWAKRDVRAGISYLTTINSLLHEDTNWLLSESREKEQEFSTGRLKYRDLQRWHRSLFRAYFAQVEGYTFALRQQVVWAADRGEVALTEAERATLLESDRFNSLKKNVELAFEFFPRIVGGSYKLDKSTSGYQSFVRSMNVRHTLTHPKDPEDLLISGDALGDLNEAIRWFAGRVIEVNNVFLAAVRLS